MTLAPRDQTPPSNPSNTSKPKPDAWPKPTRPNHGKSSPPRPLKDSRTARNQDQQNGSGRALTQELGNAIGSNQHQQTTSQQVTSSPPTQYGMCPETTGLTLGLGGNGHPGCAVLGASGNPQRLGKALGPSHKTGLNWSRHQENRPMPLGHA